MKPDQSMKIALFSHFYLPTVSGVVTSLENLRQGLSELGHQVFIVAPKSKDYFYSPEVQIIGLPSLNLKTKNFFLPLPFTLSPKIFKKIKELKPDIIHTQHPFYIGESAHFYAKRLKIPLIFTFHTQYDAYTFSYLPFLPENITARTINKYLNDFTSRCDGIITPTKTIKNKYLKNIKASKAVIPSGIDLSPFYKKPKNLQLDRGELNIKPDEIILLTISRLAKEKNIDFLIETLSLIKEENGQVKLLIVGDGPAKKGLEKLAKKRGVTSKIIFVGEVPHRKINRYYQIADIFLYSCLTDTQGLVLMEAMASQLPIVALDSPERRELVKNKKEAILVPQSKTIFAHEVIKLIKNLRLRKKLGRSAFKATQKFSYQNTAKKVAQFYRQVIKSYC